MASSQGYLDYVLDPLSGVSARPHAAVVAHHEDREGHAEGERRLSHSRVCVMIFSSPLTISSSKALSSAPIIHGDS